MAVLSSVVGGRVLFVLPYRLGKFQPFCRGLQVKDPQAEQGGSLRFRPEPTDNDVLGSWENSVIDGKDFMRGDSDESGVYPV
jgi:hypothetical protein